MIENTSVPSSSFQAVLLAWYDHTHRALPWRNCNNPYGVWVSEVMLQQTQVQRVEQYWLRFMRRFPTINELAHAPESEVLAYWSGLGYYRRARYLHAAAQTVIQQHQGRLPTTADQLACLPGMGAYTSAAVASIAFGEPVPVIDANVARVLTRLSTIPGNPAKNPAKTMILEKAWALLDHARPGDFNQALMELGSLVCTPNHPSCSGCPVAGVCQAYQQGYPERYPELPSGPSTIRLEETVAVVWSRQKVLLINQPHERNWWQGLALLPRIASPAEPQGHTQLLEMLTQHYGVTVVSSAPMIETQYSVTRFRVKVWALPINALAHPVTPRSGGWWVPVKDLKQHPLPAPYRRLVQKLIPTTQEV